ncbi:MAG: hypothetical protein AAGF31_05250 [Planctomycetota bacterium]
MPPTLRLGSHGRLLVAAYASLSLQAQIIATTVGSTMNRNVTDNEGTPRGAPDRNC